MRAGKNNYLTSIRHAHTNQIIVFAQPGWQGRDRLSITKLKISRLNDNAEAKLPNEQKQQHY